jgi:hypothetical protein
MWQTTTELVRARIAVAPGGHYDIGLDKADEADLVRFALHYYARILYELVHTCHSVRNLPARIDEIATTPFDAADDLFAMAGFNGSLVRVNAANTITLEAVLCASGARDYELRCDLSRLDATMLRGSMLAVLQAVVRALCPDMRTLLTTALMNMNASYGVTHRYADPRSLAEVPATAYRAASFV